jgi:hypothetical protein
MPHMKICPRPIVVHDRGVPVDIGIADSMHTPDIGDSVTYYYRSIREDSFGAHRSAPGRKVNESTFLWEPGIELVVEGGLPFAYRPKDNPFEAGYIPLRPRTAQPRRR